MGMGPGMDIDGAVYGDLDNDADLEAELRALQDDDESAGRVNRKGNAAKGVLSLNSSDYFYFFINLFVIARSHFPYNIAIFC